MKNPKILIAAGIIIIVLIIGGVFLLNSQTKKTPTQKSTFDDQNSEVIPTVDASVKVELTRATGSHDVTLTISNLPNGTESVDYEMSYPTKEQGLQGLASTLQVENGEDSVEKKVTLGTCSSGTCVYHQLNGNISLSLKFNGSYGERIFEKEYSL